MNQTTYKLSHSRFKKKICISPKMALPSAINPARTSQTLSVVSSSNSNIVRVPSIEILDETGGSLQVLNPGAPPPPVVVVASSKPDQHTKALQDLNDKKNSNQYDDMKDSTDNIHEAAKLR